MFAAIIEELRALRRADQMLRQCPGLDAAACIEFSEMCHRLLNDASSNSHAAHQPPIAVNLAVLSKRRVAQIHSRESKYDPPIGKIPLVGTTRPILTPTDTQVLVSIHPLRQNDPPIPPHFAQVGLRHSTPRRRAGPIPDPVD